MSEVAGLAGLHHERLDGSGHPKGVDGSFLSVQVSSLAAADAYQSLTEPRSFRAALSEDLAAQRLRQGVREGTRDRSAVTVLTAAEQESRPLPKRPAV